MPLERLTHRVRSASGDPAGALVLLHGRGADELDLQPLVDALDPQRRLIGLTPRAPLELPPGGNHWHVVARVGHPDPDTFRASLELLSDWLEKLPEETGVPPERTVIGGFSQGAVMSYALGLGQGRPAPAGLLALSGFIPTVEDFELDLENRSGFPVAIGHGAYDPVIPVDFGRAAHERLEDAGAAVLWRESPIDHTIDPSFVSDLRGWLRKVIS